MKKFMIASLVGFSLMLSASAFADCCGKCKQGAQQAPQSCCQSHANASKAGGWFTSGAGGAGAVGGKCACSTGSAACGAKQCCKAQGQAPSGGACESKAQSGGCCQQKQ